jgi:hypothetical protein
MITRLPAGVPAGIRGAVDGGLKGWQRPQRFQVAMTFPTIEAAAVYLGAHQSALVHQFRPLEKDTTSAARSTAPSPHRPMRPTRRGN